MIKAILLDADGVVIQGREGAFSSFLAEKQGISIDEIIPFFKQSYKKCALGQADLKQEISQYLDQWKWTGTADELLEFWFSRDGKPSEEVLRIIDELRSKGLTVYLASDHTKYRADQIMNDMGLKDRVEGGFFSSHLGYTKSEPEFYDAVSKELGLNPDEIAFWDDEDENIEMAKKSGVQAMLYTDIELFKNDLMEASLL